MRQIGTLLVATALATGCAMQDTTAPVPQPDSLILGRIAALREAGEPGVWEVEIKEGLPEAMRAAMEREARGVPGLDKDLLVKVRVTAETVCVSGMRAGDLDEFRVGQEVAVNPVPGTTAMVGTKLLLADAAEMYLFAAYQLRFLPRSLDALPPEVTSPADPARINSAGMEMTPIPVQNGRVVYFAAGLTPGLALKGGDASPWGAVRAGMRGPSGALAPWAVGGCRPYRVAWEKGAWGEPRPVEFAGLGPDVRARVTWVNDDETSCLVEVMQATGERHLAAAHRPSARAPWGALEKLAVPGGSSVGDGQRFGLQLKALVWTVYDANGSDLWLSTEGKPGQPLEPRINTMGPEYAPRVGPKQSLSFCRGDRQLMFGGGVVNEVRLPGKQRRPLLEAAPAAGGTLLFFRVPRFTPGTPDWDLAVAARAGSGWGRAVLLDDWKPE